MGWTALVNESSMSSKRFLPTHLANINALPSSGLRVYNGLKYIYSISFIFIVEIIME